MIKPTIPRLRELLDRSPRSPGSPLILAMVAAMVAAMLPAAYTGIFGA